MSTIGPLAARELAALCAERGVAMLDAPFSGSTAAAEAAALAVMAGGEEAAFERARPVLAAMSKAQLHLGPSGAGAAVKLGLNVVIAANTLAISEALVLAERSGVEREAAYEAIGSSAVASPFVDYKRAAFLDPDGTPTAFALEQMAKDLGLARGLGERDGLPLLGAAASAEAIALAAGLEGPDADLVAVADALRRVAAGRDRCRGGTSVKAVHHVGITVPDIERGIKFYTGVLGLEFNDPPSPVFDEPELGPAVGVPGANLRQANLKLGEVIVELLEYTRPEPPYERPVPANAHGAAHLAFLVEDVEAKKAELEAAGVEFLSDVNVVDEGVLAGWRWVYFRDPFGIVLELVEVAYRDEEAAQRGIAEYTNERLGAH
jgi:catechol 2,3-dioxygenase-like lactoylglutathione lyase family enzyme